MHPPKKKRKLITRILAAFLKVLVVLTVGVVICVTGALLFAERLIPPLSQHLGGVFTGTLTIDNVDDVSFWGATGVDATLEDSRGRQIGRVWNASARTSWYDLIRDVLSDDGRIDLRFHDLKVEAIHLDLSSTERGTLELVEALTPPPSNKPKKEGPDVTVRLPGIRVESAWIYGSVQGTRLDATLEKVSGNLTLDEEILRLSAVQTVALVRAPVDTDEVQIKGGLLLRGGELQADASGQFEPSFARRYGVRAQAPLQFAASAKGPPSNLLLHLDVQHDESKVTLRGHLQTEEGLKLSGQARGEKIAGALFGVDDLSPINLETTFEVMQAPQTSTDTGAWSAAARGKLEPMQHKSTRTPAIGFDARLEGDTAFANVATADGSSRIQARALLGGSGLEELLTSGTIDARLLGQYSNQKVSAQGDLRFNASLSRNLRNLEARFEADLPRVRAGDALSAKNARLEGSASGPTDDPSLHLQGRIEHLTLGNRSLRDVNLLASGNLSSTLAQISAVQITADRRKASRADSDGTTGDQATDDQAKATEHLISLSARISLGNGGVRVSETDFAFATEGSDFVLSAETIEIGQGRVEFSHVRLRGMGTSDLSGMWSQGELRLKGHVRDAPLHELGRAMDFELPVSAIVDLDADFTWRPNASHGRLRLVGVGIGVDDSLVEGGLPNTTVHADVIGRGATMVAALQAESSPLPGSARGSSLELTSVLKTPSSQRAKSAQGLLKDVVSVRGRTDLEVAHLSRFIQDGGEAEGRLSVDLHADQGTSLLSSPIFLSARSRGLALTFPEPVKTEHSNANGVPHQPTRLEQVDLNVYLEHDPATANTKLGLEIFHRDRLLAAAQGHLLASLKQLSTTRNLSDAKDLPFELSVSVVPTALDQLPSALGSAGMSGIVGGDLDVRGPLASPQAELRGHFEGLRQADTISREVPLNLAGTVFAKYDGRSVHLQAHGRSPSGAGFDATAEVPLRLDPVTFRPHPQDISAKVRINDFPLESVEALSQRQLQGQMDLSLDVSSWGTKEEKVDVDLRLEDATVERVPLAHAQAQARLRAGHLVASMELGDANYSAKARGEVDLERNGLLGIELRKTRKGTVTVRDLPLALLSPLFDDQLAGVRGQVDLSLRAEERPESVDISGKLALKNGSVQVPAIGQKLRNIDLEAKWTQNGDIEIKNAKFSGESGRGTLDATIEMDGLAIQEASLRVKVARTERIPVSLLGMGTGEFWGDVRADAKFDHDARRIEISGRAREFKMWFPELPTRRVQALVPAPQVKVGALLDGSDFTEIPLQPVEEKKKTKDSYELDARFDLGDEFWLQQGPSRRVQIAGKVRARVEDEVRLSGKLRLPRGQFELNGRTFEVYDGTITFQPDEPDNPVIVLDARWYSPEGITVIASFTGPAKTGTMELKSDPPLREDQVVSLLLFGDTSGLGEGSTAGSENSESQAAVVGGGVATQGLNRALSQFEAVDLSTRVKGEEGNVRPEIVVQLTNSLSAQLGYNLEEPSPGKSPDRTMLTFELRLMGGSAISATVGDRGTTLVDWVWRHRY